MKCPYCNEEMESGYVQCRDGVVWTRKKRLVPAFPSLSKETINLGINDGSLCRQSAVAYNCIKCKKVILNYD